MFKCKRCSEKDLRITDLKEQISYLKNMLTPETNGVPTSLMEADAIMSGRQDVIELFANAPTPSPDSEAGIQSERDRLIAGTY